MKLILAGSAGLSAHGSPWRSLGWPLIHDAPIMHYVAWLITQGAVPYRDAFDMNMPGAYLIHWAVLSVAGPGDLAWRLFDLAWLLGDLRTPFPLRLPARRPQRRPRQEPCCLRSII